MRILGTAIAGMSGCLLRQALQKRVRVRYRETAYLASHAMIFSAALKP